jgi:hypothetical protein
MNEEVSGIFWIGAGLALWSIVFQETVLKLATTCMRLSNSRRDPEMSAGEKGATRAGIPALGGNEAGRLAA